jgi:hypothetical protein
MKAKLKAIRNHFDCWWVFWAFNVNCFDRMLCRLFSPIPKITIGKSEYPIDHNLHFKENGFSQNSGKLFLKIIENPNRIREMDTSSI